MADFMQENSWDLEGVRLQIARGPCHGPPLILLHGVVRRWSDFVPLLPYLQTRWEIYAVDMRGHGGSARVPGQYRVCDYVDDIEALLRQLPEPAALYGHSLGAMVALAAAAREPDRVRALVLEDPPFHTMGRDIESTVFHSQFLGLTHLVRPGKTTRELAVELAQLPLRTPGRPDPVLLGQLRDKASLRFMASCLTQLDPDVLVPIVAGRWLDEYEGPTYAQRVTAPTLVLEADGAAGGMLTAADSAALTAHLPESCTIRFPGLGHLLHWLAPEQVARPTLAWLEATR